MRMLWMTKYDPTYVYYPYGYFWGVTSIPLYSFLANTTMPEISMRKLIIQMNDPDDHATID